MSLVYPNENNEKISMSVQGESNLRLTFSSNNGKHSTDETLDIIKIKAADLLELLQAWEDKKIYGEDIIKKPNLEVLNINIDDLPLSVRTHNCLRSQSIKTIRDLVKYKDFELLRFRCLGRKSLHEIHEKVLDKYGLRLGMEVSDEVD